jgi:hypothetical protein
MVNHWRRKCATADSSGGGEFSTRRSADAT